MILKINFKKNIPSGLHYYLSLVIYILRRDRLDLDLDLRMRLGVDPIRRGDDRLIDRLIDRLADLRSLLGLRLLLLRLLLLRLPLRLRLRLVLANAKKSGVERRLILSIYLYKNSKFSTGLFKVGTSRVCLFVTIVGQNTCGTVPKIGKFGCTSFKI